MAVLRSFLHQWPQLGLSRKECGVGRLGSTAMALMAASMMPQPSQAGPVLCTTTLEAPLVQAGQPLPARSGPTEVTRCGVVGTVPELVEQRYFSYRSSFARGVGIPHQITDALGLAMGGSDGNRLMGLGFPDQAVIWDGSAIENTTTFLMDQQVHLVPRRTADLPTAFTTSVGSGRRLGGDGDSAPLAYPANGFDPR